MNYGRYMITLLALEEPSSVLDARTPSQRSPRSCCYFIYAVPRQDLTPSSTPMPKAASKLLSFLDLQPKSSVCLRRFIITWSCETQQNSFTAKNWVRSIARCLLKFPQLTVCLLPLSFMTNSGRFGALVPSCTRLSRPPPERRRTRSPSSFPLRLQPRLISCLF